MLWILMTFKYLNAHKAATPNYNATFTNKKAREQSWLGFIKAVMIHTDETQLLILNYYKKRQTVA